MGFIILGTLLAVGLSALVIDAVNDTEEEISKEIEDLKPEDFQDKDIAGTAGDDLLAGAEGNDVIDGQSGDDFLIGDDGNDVIRGGAGDDIASGGEGNDRVFLEEGDDIYPGADGRGDDIVRGGEGSDRIVDLLGENKLFGDTGADEIVALDLEDEATPDSLDGGFGQDDLLGDNGDVFTGGAQSDSFTLEFDPENEAVSVITDYDPEEDGDITVRATAYAGDELEAEEAEVGDTKGMLIKLGGKSVVFIEGADADVLENVAFESPDKPAEEPADKGAGAPEPQAAEAPDEGDDTGEQDAPTDPERQDDDEDAPALV